jgi:putative flavoprotein involved in K+ transport
MPAEKTEVLIVGGGQAGLATSRHLARHGIPHLVLERARIAERWRSERWDSLVANGPAWHDRFPDRLYAGTDPDRFPGKEEIADYFVDYARQIGAPVRTGVEVTRLTRIPGQHRFRAETPQGEIEAAFVVAATGPFQKPVTPALIPEGAGIFQIHSAAYRNPAQLPEGGVLVVGAGSSGAQIAGELLAAGRRVVLAVGPHDRPPRRYRGRDFVWWLGVLGKWDIETPAPGTEHVTIAVSGANGGHTVDFRRFAAAGMTLVGRAESFDGGVMGFAPDLAANIARGDANYLSVLDEADAYAEKYGLDLPPEPEARILGPATAGITDPPRRLDLAAEGINAVIWATGFTFDFGWLQVDAFDERGRPAQKRGISTEPGVYFVGQSWLTRRGSAFIWGAWQDARLVADHIAKERGYMSYPAMSTKDGSA